MHRIALIEDHDRLVSLVQRGMVAAGIAVDAFPGVEAAWHAVRAAPYAALIVDRGLPDGDGIELVRRLRAAGHRTPCLLLTARDALRDRVDGLEAGADDYLVKPFEMAELVARVRALMRRPATVRALEVEYLGVRVVPDAGCMVCGEDTISLAPAELQILICLLQAEGRTVRRAALESAGWGVGTAVTPNAVDVALHRLRRKLAAFDGNVGLVNIRGHGFAVRALDASA